MGKISLMTIFWGHGSQKAVLPFGRIVTLFAPYVLCLDAYLQ